MNSASPDWWQSFFSGLAVEFWQAAIPEEATARDLSFLWKHLALAAGSRVLDAACGAGRLTHPLAARGCAMTGVDISAEFLTAARGGGSEGPGSAQFRLADMRDLPWQAEFDAAFCFGNSFGFLDDAGNDAFLRAVARALKPRGRFALDYGQTAESVLVRPGFEGRQEGDVAGFHFAEDTRYDPGSARIENRFTFSRNGRTETKLASQRVYLLADLMKLLAEAGFEVGPCYGSPLEEPFALGSHRLLLVAARRR